MVLLLLLLSAAMWYSAAMVTYARFVNSVNNNPNCRNILKHRTKVPTHNTHQPWLCCVITINATIGAGTPGWQQEAIIIIIHFGPLKLWCGKSAYIYNISIIDTIQT